VVVALSVAAAFGITRIRVDDSLSQLFRSDSAEFRQFEELSRRFPSSEFDVLVVVEGPKLLERESLEAMRNLASAVQLVDGVNGIISVFSARQPPAPGQLPAPLFPEDLPEGQAFGELVERVRANEIIRGKLLSEDGQLALVVLSLDQSIVEREGLRDVVGEIRKVVEEEMGKTGLKTQLSGVPVMQLEIRNAVERDRLLYNAIGFVAGCLIAVLFFRRVAFVFMAAAPPLVAILWSLGLLGWLDFRLNMFLNVITPLIMVMGFSDSMQITFAARDRLLAGDTPRQALRTALLVVGPACVVTVATAALSFVALLLADSHLIRTFGAAGALSTLISYVAVITLVPLFGVLFLRRTEGLVAKAKDNDRAVDALRHICGWVADHMVRRPVLYSALSILLVGGLVGVYTGLEPRYRLADQVPDREQAVEASGRLDAKLAGANPIHILIEFPPGANLYGPETLQVIGKVHGIVEQHSGVGNVWSLETLRRWLADKAGISDVGVLQAIREPAAPAPDPPVHLGVRGRRGGDRAHPRQGHQRAPAGGRQPRQGPVGRPREACRLPGLGHRALGHRGPQQRRHDRPAQPGPHRRDGVRGRDHRPRLPVGLRGGGQHPARACSRSWRRARCCRSWARGCNSRASWPSRSRSGSGSTPRSTTSTGCGSRRSPARTPRRASSARPCWSGRPSS
jgi:predicted RND superfamily exporter protein